MAVQPTTLRITPAFVNKRMTVEGSPAVNELVDVTVGGVNDPAGDGGYTAPEGLVLRLVSEAGHTLAKFPASADDAWGVSDGDATCVLNLNTEPLRRAFQCAWVCGTLPVHILLENGETDNLYAVGSLTLRNWVQNPLDPTAGFSQMADVLATLRGRIDNHTHDGADSATVSHNNLTGRDAPGCHPALENEVAQFEGMVVTESGLRITGDENLGARIDGLESVVNGVPVAKAGNIAQLKALSDIPAQYTDNDIYQKLNAVVQALRSLFP